MPATPIRIGIQPKKTVISPSGIVVIDKPTDITSHAVVSRVRKVLKTRKVGHAGTLDPQATGVLVIGVGSATRLLGYLTKDDKAYRATIRLGVSTVSDDAEGDVTARASCRGVTVEEVRAAFALQVGAIEQVPSAVSAVKIDGRRAHARVRAGEQVQLVARKVRIERLDLISIEHGGDMIDVDVAVDCSAGTYIRAIARDVGTHLGVGGHVMGLRRTRSGVFDIAEAVPLSQWSAQGYPDAVESLTTPFDVATRAFSTLEVDEAMSQAVVNGGRMMWPGGSDDQGMIALVHGRKLLALGERSGPRLRYLAVFADQDGAKD